MAVEYDKNKNLENIKKHGISFEVINSFQWNIVYTTEDIRHDYGEERFISYGFIEQRLHVLVWTLRESGVRPISIRKANKRERRFYEQNI